MRDGSAIEQYLGQRGEGYKNTHWRARERAGARRAKEIELNIKYNYYFLN